MLQGTRFTRTFITQLSSLFAVAILLAASTAQAQPPAWVDSPGVEHAIEVLENVTDALMAKQDVEGTGVGYNDNGKVAIKVYTARAGVPGIPRVIEQVPVQVVVSGMFVARADPTVRFPRPVPIGVSTGHPDITAGTIGARVTDGTDVYALSNNHVYANSNDAAIGDNVLQPGSYDGGSDPTDTIGTLFSFVPINFSGGDNTMDAAIAITSTSSVSTATPIDDGYGVPNATTVSAYAGQPVQKYGRTTGWTQGTVDATNVVVDVCYEARGPFRCVKLARFVNQIIITPGTFSDGGDSGSLIVTNDASKNPVGLLFAGSSAHTIANPIDPVLAQFGVTIDDSAGGIIPTNYPPTADFISDVSNLTVDFTDQSAEPGGSIANWSWDFGDSIGTSAAQNPSYTYAAAGTYTVSLTVTDDDGETGMTAHDVTVSEPVVGNFTLSATGYKVKGLKKVDLVWSGVTTNNVDVYRNGTVSTTTSNDGAYTDNIDTRGGGSYIYQVCEAGSTSNCSNDVTVIF